MSDPRNIGDLLNFHFNADLFEQKAENLSMLSGIKSCMKRLEELSSKLTTDSSAQGRVSSTFMKELKAEYQDGSLFAMEFSNQQLRFLSYNLPVDDYDFLVYVLTILEKSYRPSMIGGFFHSLLYHWNEWQPEEKALIIDHMRKMRVFELNSYRGIDTYLTESGPYRLGLKIRRDGQPFVKACSTLCLSSSSLSYQYFSDVIYAYYEEMPHEELSALIEILKKHNNHYTSLLVLSRQVVRCKKNTGSLSDHLFSVCMELIGNPEIDVNWSLPEDSSDEQKSMVRSARQIIQTKINERFIRTFFERLCDDDARRDFWMNHCERVTELTVYGSSYSRSRMLNFFTEDLLVAHFKTLTNNSDTCALVMQTGNFVIIEFTDVGALYVYKKRSQLYNLIFSSEIKKVDDLKISTLSPLIGSDYYSYLFNDEGRMIHTGYWQQRLDMWIERKLN